MPNRSIMRSLLILTVLNKPIDISVALVYSYKKVAFKLYLHIHVFELFRDTVTCIALNVRFRILDACFLVI